MITGKKIKKSLGLLCISLGLFSLACCSEKPKARIDSCNILDKETAAKIIGEETADPVSNKQGSKDSAFMTLCSYVAKNGVGAKAISLTIRYAAPRENEKDPLERYVNGMRSYMGKDFKLEDVSDLGVKAGWDPKLLQLTFFLGQDMVITSGQNLDAAKETARLTLTKLNQK